MYNRARTAQGRPCLALMHIHYGTAINLGEVVFFCQEAFKEGLACSRRSDSGARAKSEASERAGKNEGRLGKRTSSLVLFPSLPSFFPALSLALFFARAPPSERLEQAKEG